MPSETDADIDNWIQSGFRTRPDSVKPSIYGYWIYDNISKGGVEKDLDRWRRWAIGTAFIGNIGLAPADDCVYGKVKQFSEEWWDILKHVIRTHPSG